MIKTNLFARFEPDSLPWRNWDFGTRPGIPSDSTLSRLHHKDSEAAELDPLAALHGGLESLEYGVHGRFGTHFGDAHLIRNACDDVLFNH